MSVAPPVQVYAGNCLKLVAGFDAESVDAVVTDPPYGLEFMGKGWDQQVPGPEYWTACLRVLKPGGHLLAFGGTRTAHRMACAIEDAGFEIRDSITWLYGSGFPKSLDVSKAIDKAAGAEREVVGLGPDHAKRTAAAGSGGTVSREGGDAPIGQVITAPATDAARQWQGWGTALKPASEPIVVARKPLSGTVAANVLQHGTGALNIDACRVEGAKPDTTRGASVNASSMAGPLGGQGRIVDDGKGRWPANVVLSHAQAPDGGDACADGCVEGCPVAELDAQSGTLKSGGANRSRAARDGSGVYGATERAESSPYVTDSGTASRFFPTFRYQAKAPTRERPKVDGVVHPTVKPLSLMRWLVRLVTPPDGLVLDPFAGSGTTGEAAALEGCRAVLIERADEYLPLIAARLDRAEIAHEVVKTPTPAPAEDAPAPVVELADPLLDLIAAAPDDDALTALWEQHAEAWADEHTVAVRARLAEIGAVAA